LITIIPENTTKDKISLLKNFGVEVWRSSSKAQKESAVSSINVAKKVAQEIKNSYIIDEVKKSFSFFFFHSIIQLFFLFSSALILYQFKFMKKKLLKNYLIKWMEI